MNKNMVLISLISLLVSQEAYALQRYEFNEEVRVEGSISIDELNRIKIEGDRIKEVIGLSKEFIVEGDAQNGQIFIKSTSNESTKPAIFSIITEAGRTQDFKLMPKSIPGETIIIEGYMKMMTGGGREIGVKHGKHSEIIEVIKKAAVNNYIGIEFDKKQTAGLEMTLLGTKNVEGYQVEVWEVKNIMDEAMEIDERGFAAEGNGIYAVGVEQVYLQPGERTRVYAIGQK